MKLTITRGLSSEELKELCIKEHISFTKIEMGTDTFTFLLPSINNGENSLSIIFLKKKLVMVNIGLRKQNDISPFEIAEDEKKILNERLLEIGGANIYSWGSVSLNDDKKGGFLSILIKYRDE